MHPNANPEFTPPPMRTRHDPQPPIPHGKAREGVEWQAKPEVLSVREAERLYQWLDNEVAESTASARMRDRSREEAIQRQRITEMMGGGGD